MYKCGICKYTCNYSLVEFFLISSELNAFVIAFVTCFDKNFSEFSYFYKARLMFYSGVFVGVSQSILCEQIYSTRAIKKYTIHGLLILPLPAVSILMKAHVRQ